MTKLARYLFGTTEATSIPTRTIGGEHWYMAAVICSLLGYSNHSKTVHDHLYEHEWRKETIYIGGNHGKKHVLLINNSGMLKLIMLAKPEFAQTFKKRAEQTPAYLKDVKWPTELFEEKTT